MDDQLLEKIEGKKKGRIDGEKWKSALEMFESMIGLVMKDGKLLPCTCRNKNY